MARFRTQQDLVNAVLARLGVMSAGQPADPEDVNYVTVELDGIYRKLQDLDIIAVPDPQNIQAEWLPDLADIVAGEVATKFGAKTDDYMRLVNKGLGGVQGVDVGYGAAAKSLRFINRGRSTGEVLRTLYF